MSTLNKLSIAITSHNEGDALFQLLNTIREFCVDDAPRLKLQVEVVLVDDFSKDSRTQEILNLFQFDVKKLFGDISSNNSSIFVTQKKFTGNFADHKNYLSSLCSGEYILNLDADEHISSSSWLGVVPALIDANPYVDIFGFPRVNTVDGITWSHMTKWGWVASKLEEYTRIEEIRRDSPKYKFLKDMGFIINTNTMKLMSDSEQKKYYTPYPSHTYYDDLEKEKELVTYYIPIINWPDIQHRLYRNDPHKIQWIGNVHERLGGINMYSPTKIHLPLQPEWAIEHHKTIQKQEIQNNLYETLRNLDS